jgi:hypothetical protein
MSCSRLARTTRTIHIFLDDTLSRVHAVRIMTLQHLPRLSWHRESEAGQGYASGSCKPVAIPFLGQEDPMR